MRHDAMRAGMTMLELVAALTLLGLLLMVASALVGASVGASDAIARFGRRRATTEVTEHLLRTLLSRARSADSVSAGFTGDAHGATFTSLCTDPGGDFVRCLVTLETDATTGVAGMHGERERSGFSVHIRVTAQSLAYLPAHAARRAWRTDWDHTGTPPAAIAFITRADTLVRLVGHP